MDDAPILPEVVSAYKSTRGRPKRFSQSWNTMMKSIYISEKSWIDFRQLKEANGFSSDDSTMQYILKKCNSAENQHSATLRQPLRHSTPCATPGNTECCRLLQASPQDRLVDNLKYICSWLLHDKLFHNLAIAQGLNILTMMMVIVILKLM